MSWPHGPPQPAPRADAAPRPAQLTGLAPDSFEVVSEDGSPCGAKTFVLWNPPPLPERRRGRPPPPSRTIWTRRVPHLVLIGHAASLTPY